MVTTNRSAPTATIVPILIYEDVGQAIDWLCRAFGFTERLRVERDGVIGHAQLTVAVGALMLGRQGGPCSCPARSAAPTPMTYMFRGKQYIVVAIGGIDADAEYVALALP